MITKPDSIYQPFCSDGVEGIDYTLPPDSGADTSIVSQPLGAPEIMEEPISAGGLPLLRKQFNGVLKKYSDILLWTNAGGQFTFDSTIATETNGYPKDTILFNPETGRFVKSLIDNNTDNFLTNPNKIDNVSWADTQVTLLGNNVNVHTLTTPGIYFQNNPAYATTALNYPFNGFTGAIQVVSVNDGLGSFSISQMATVVNTSATTNNSIYNCSNYAGNGFSAWVKQATVNQLQDSSTDIAARALSATNGVSSTGTGEGGGYGFAASTPNGISAPNGNSQLGALTMYERATANKGIVYPNTPGAAGPFSMEFGWNSVGGRVVGRVDNNNSFLFTLANYSDVINNGGGIVASGGTNNSGYVKFANNLIVAWGQALATNGNSFTIIYPITFQSTPSLTVTLAQGAPDPAWALVRSSDRFQFTCISYASTGGIAVNLCNYSYIAIGY
jgi:hypothetical protein